MEEITTTTERLEYERLLALWSKGQATLEQKERCRQLDRRTAVPVSTLVAAVSQLLFVRYLRARRAGR